jgi:hypothetical protein
MWQWMMAGLLLAMVAVSAPLFAQEGEPEKKPAKSDEAKPAEPAKEGDKKEEGGEKKDGEKEEDNPIATYLKDLLKGLDDVVGKTEFNEEDVKLVLKHHEALDAVLEGDEKFAELKDKNVKEAFDHMIKSEAYLEWCKKEKIEAEPYARKMVRIRMTFSRLYFSDFLDRTVKAAKEQVESDKESIPEEEYKGRLKDIAEFEKQIPGAKKEIEKISAPTDAEKKLLESNKKALMKTVDWGEDEEDEDKGEDKGEDGEDGNGMD